MKLGKPLSGTIEIDPPPTEDEKTLLVSQWNRFVPAYRGLMEAEDYETLFITGQKPKGRFVWDGRIRSFLDVKKKRYLTRLEVRNALDVFIKAYTG